MDEGRTLVPKVQAIFQHHIPQVVLLGALRTLGVQALAVGAYIVEPHLFSSHTGCAFGEHQDRRLHAGVGLEHAPGQRDHCVELVLVDQLAA